MKYYLIEISNYTNGASEARAVYAYDSKDEAVANFHKKLGGAMGNENYKSELIMVISPYRETPATPEGYPIEYEYWERPEVVEDKESETNSQS